MSPSPWLGREQHKQQRHPSPAADSAAYYFIFYATLTLASLSITSVFRLVGCLFQDLAVANAAAGLLLLMLIVNSGYVIVHSAIPDWVVCFYWISPFAYAVRAMAINEMTSPRWRAVPTPAGDGAVLNLGVQMLDAFDLYSDRCVCGWVALGHVDASVGCRAQNWRK